MIQLKHLLTEGTYPSGGVNGTWAGSGPLLDKITNDGQPLVTIKGNTKKTLKPTGVQVKRESKFTANGNIGDHWKGQTASAAYDIATGGSLDVGDQAKDYVIKQVENLSPYKQTGNIPGTKNYWVKHNKQDYRIQILWRTVDHYDHVHVGVRNTAYPDDTNFDKTPIGTAVTPVQEYYRQISCIKWLQDTVVGEDGIEEWLETEQDNFDDDTGKHDFVPSWWNKTGLDKSEVNRKLNNAANYLGNIYTTTYRSSNVAYRSTGTDKNVTTDIKSAIDSNWRQLDKVVEEYKDVIRNRPMISYIRPYQIYVPERGSTGPTGKWTTTPVSFVFKF
jgi:hypothetical protein